MKRRYRKRDRIPETPIIHEREFSFTTIVGNVIMETNHALLRDPVNVAIRGPAMIDTRKKTLTFVSRFRKEVEDWLKFHGLVLSGAEWYQPYETGARGEITFENHYWQGTIFEHVGPNIPK